MTDINRISRFGTSCLATGVAVCSFFVILGIVTTIIEATVWVAHFGGALTSTPGFAMEIFWSRLEAVNDATILLSAIINMAVLIVCLMRSVEPPKIIVYYIVLSMALCVLNLFISPSLQR